MSEIPKAYEPQSVESKWYQFWLDQKCFIADPARVSEKRPSYSIVIPPPNVTGVLHMGHVLNNTVQDILARKARMDGKEVLWLPGTDHAGIATQAVVEKALKKQGVMKHRDELGREKFLEHVWEWKEKHGDIIIEQLKKLGCSCDWMRLRFTMEPEYSRCVQKVFVDLYKKGLIYRGKRMVNWDPAARTALSDEEVEMIEEKGHLWHIKYPLLDERGQPKADEFVIVATTRPETMLGDEAVAVNPKDGRYSKFVGRKCLLPLRNKSIPIIADDAVDPKFGTGCVKVTPAHDPADYEMAVRHKLPLTLVIASDGTMTTEAGEDFDGLDRMEARKAVVEELTEQGLLVKTEDYVHNVGYSQRSHVPIEPYLSEQWFLKYPSVEKARECVEQEGSATVPVADSGVSPESSARAGIPFGETPNGATGTVALPNTIRFHPQRWAKVYDHWMRNIRDWCISRQLWWGHRVPVWYRKSEIRNPKSEITNDDIYCGVEPPADPENWEQDPDVLDTWASSWLWPFATMGWTGDESQDSKNPTLQAFYPTTDLVTAPEIIFFWVARMIMAGFEYMGDVPFRNVYFTGIIRDKLGRKMSKSLGNSPDPLDLIAKFGADAVRFGTMRSAPLGQDVMFDEKDVELGRNFCNKLWNACRFRQMQGSAGASPAREGVPPEQSGIEAEINPALLTTDDKWILLKLDKAIREMDAAFAEYKFNEATQTLYRFFWSEYCDWYVEASKAVLGRATDAGIPSPLNGERARVRGEEQSDVSHDAAAPRHPDLPPAARGGEGETMNAPSGSDAHRVNTLAVIDFVLSHTLRLFHPFLPFITEELWHGMGYAHDLPHDQGGATIMFAHWPKPFDADFKEHYGLDDCYLDFVDTRFELVTLGRNLRRENNIASNKKVKFVLKPSDGLPPHDVEVLKILLNAEPLILDANYEPPKGTPSVHSKLGELYLPLEGLRDVAAEKVRLQKELSKIDTEIQKVEQKLNNPAFVQKVPPVVLAENQQRLADWQAKRARVEASLNSLES